MNIKLVSAIAAALGLAAGTASADLGKVGVYGEINAAYNYLDFDNDANGEDADYALVNNRSRIGMWAEAGPENLGAFVLLEYGIDPVNGSGISGARNQVAGFKGAWGSAFVGTHDTPLKVLGDSFEQFQDLYLADIRFTTPGQDRRTGINYRGAFSGLGVWVQTGPNQLATDEENPLGFVNASVTYKDGGLTAGYALEVVDNGDGAAEDITNRVVVGYEEKGVFAVAGLLQSTDDSDPDNSDIDFGISGSVNLDDANVLKAQVVIEPQDDDNGARTGERMVTVGWEQQTTENVSFYAYVSRYEPNTEVDDDEAMTVGAGFEINFGNKKKGLY